MEAVEVSVPTGLRGADGAPRRLWLRPWSGGDVAALAEAGTVDAPAAVRSTALLGRCLSLDGGATAAGEAAARALTAGDREALLLHLRRLTVGDRLDLVAGCSRCSERLELELETGDLLLATDPPCPTERAIELSGPNGGVPVRVRLPTGEDQERAALRPAGDEAAAVRELLQACVLEVAGDRQARLPRELEEALADKLAELDPQAEIRLAASCPHCGAALDLELDAGTLVHAEIDAALERLFREVHLLALYYHWSEAEILALSARRRRLYLDLLAGAGGEA